MLALTLRSHLLRRATHLLLVMTLLATTVVSSIGIASPVAYAADWEQPTYVRSIGGTGAAGVYAWGIEYNPVTDQILVGDYWNYLIRQYDLDGNDVGSFFRLPSERVGQPYTVSVDPRNGDIWTPEISDGSSPRMTRYDKDGNFIADYGLSVGYMAWTNIRDGYLYVADSHYWNNSGNPPEIIKYDIDAGVTEVSRFGEYGTGGGEFGIIHGMDFDASGNIYLADAGNLNVHVYSPTGTWLYDFGGQGNAVGQFKGDLRGLVVDEVNGWVYVVDAQASQIEKFDIDGTPLLHWGSEGAGDGQFADGGREITLDADGNVWVADFGNFRVQQFDSDGNLMAIHPNPPQPPAEGMLNHPRDVAVDPVTGSIWTAEPWNQRFQEFASDGSFLEAWGTRNSLPPYGMNYPRGIGIDPVTREIWVANTRDHLIRVYDNDGNYLRQVGDGIDSTGVGSLRWPMDIEFFGDRVYVSDYVSNRVKWFDSATGVELGSIGHSNSGVSVDPATGNVYVVSWSSDRVFIYDPSGSYIDEFGRSGSDDGEFENPWDIDIINGYVYVTDSALDRVQVFNLDGDFVGKWGTRGSGAYELKDPSGLTHDAAGNIYVTDTGNDRIQVYSSTTPVPGTETDAPVAAFTSPMQSDVMPAGTVAITGTATDESGVVTVEVAIKDRDSNLWWDGQRAEWQTGKAWSIASWTGSANTAVDWNLGFIAAIPAGRYYTQVRATDVHGNTPAEFPWVNWSVEYPPTNTVLPAISGTAEVGEVLSTSDGSWTGTAPITFTYQWQQCDGGCSDIAGATSSTYTVGASDVGSSLTVVVTGSNVAGSVEALAGETSVVPVPPDPPLNTSPPVISGTAEVGEVLSTTDGSWTGTAPITFTYQWQRCDGACVNISGEEGSTYTVTSSDIGSSLTVVVTGSNVAGSVEALAGETSVVPVPPDPPLNTSPPVISGTAEVGEVLSTTDGSWTGTAPIAFTYQWQRCDGACVNISGEEGSTYTVTSSDIGSSLAVVVTGSNVAGSVEALAGETSVVPVPPDPPLNTSPPVISGTAEVGEVLSTTDGSWTGTAPIAFTYQWQQCDVGCSDITGATSSTYTVGALDVGFSLTVVVTASNPGGLVSATAEATAVVPPVAPANTVLPVISGTAQVGEELSTTDGTWTGTLPINFEYQWQRCDPGCSDITGAESSTYTVTSSDIGSSLTVIVTGSNVADSVEAIAAATAVVPPVPPANTVLPVISGTAQVGEVLSTSDGSWTGTAPIAFEYQWQRCDGACANITGAESSTYTVTTSDIGASLTVIVTGTNTAGSSSVTAAQTGAVPDPDPDPEGTFVDDDGSVHEAAIEAIAALGITKGCNPPVNNMFCPDDPVTRGAMAAFLNRALDLDPTGTDFFKDDETSVFEGDINRLAAAGITLGCNPPVNDRFCPDDPVTRGAMAAFLNRALGLDPTGLDFFLDDDASVFEGDINRLAAAGITLGCNPPTNNRYCPNSLVTRAQMATFLARALKLDT